MIDALLVPFHYEYMQKAMFISALIGGVCAMLSCFITLKGWSLMGDALSHSIVPGISLAYLSGIPFVIGAFVSGILASGAMAFVKNNTRIKEDAVIGIVFTAFFALGLVLISIFPSNINLKTIVFGNTLGIADSDIVQILIVSAITLIVILLKWRDLLLFCFDSNHARSLGLNVRFLHITLLTLFAITTVAALQAVGVCLVVAMVITPGATAYLLTDRFDRMMVIAVCLGVASSLVGAYLSYYINGSTGGCIVALQTIVFLLVFMFAPKYGVLASRKRRLLVFQQSRL